jgi:hypothetical protein
MNTDNLVNLKNRAWTDWMHFAHQQAMRGAFLECPHGTSPHIANDDEGRTTATFFNLIQPLQVFVWNNSKECFEFNLDLTLQARQPA